MIWNYLKISYRSLIRQKTYSLINISGLALGLASFILISVWIINELQYDRFHEKKDRIYRLNTVGINYFDNSVTPSSSWRLGPALTETYSEIESYTRLWPWSRSLVKYNDKVFDETEFYLADPAFFLIFTFPFKYGTPDKALADKHSLVLTETAAQRYFGDADPIGQMLYVQRYDRMFEISGVIFDLPENSSVKFDFMGRVDLMPQQRMESWEFTGYTVVLMKPNISIEKFEHKIYSFYRDNLDPEIEYSLVLQSLTDIHLYQDGTPGLIKQIYLFSVIAIFTLLIACINFINLSTARAAKRAKEIGIRKVVGAVRKQLILQFFAESIMVTFIALLFAILLIEISLPFLNQFTGKNLGLFSGQLSKTIFLLTGVTFFTGLISGSYPAIYLSVYQPSKILKSITSTRQGSVLFRKTLTIIQFTISIGLIICTLLVYQQLQYIQNKDIGMNRDHVIYMPNNPDLGKNFDEFKTELLRNNLASTVSATAVNPFNVGQVISLNWEGHYNQEEIPIRYTMVDYDYFKTMDIKFLEGRPFSKDFVTDETEACIINETALKTMNLNSAVGKEAYFNHPAFDEEFKKVNIIGVVKDFHFQNFYKQIGPFVFRIYRPWHSFVLIRLGSENIQDKLIGIEQITKKIAPDYPFNFQFLDEVYGQIYQAENRLATLFNVFAILAIAISCLGLFGLSSFMIVQRTKEIGIRKVLGASVGNILSMLSHEFTLLLIIANLISWPIAGFYMYNWLQNFSYHIDLSVWIFIIAGASAFIVALLTVGYQSLKAAISKPIEALRYE